MTRPRFDKHSTEFGLWLREQSTIDSKLGYVATNLDYVWQNYKTGQWMLFEEKRYNSWPRRWQLEIFRLLNSVAMNSALYRGFYIVVFEKTNPDDGAIRINRQDATLEDLLNLLKFDVTAIKKFRYVNRSKT